MCENGEYHKELLGKMDELEDKVDADCGVSKRNEEVLQKINTCIIGSVNGSTIGILERVRVIEKWIENRIWFERLLIAAIAAQFIILAFQLIPIIIEHTQ